MVSDFTGHSQTRLTIEELIKSDESDHAQFGISVRSLDGTVIFNYQGDTRLIPASTLKIVTTLSAIEILGRDYQYETRIGYAGELLSEGTLVGNLVIMGAGDPSFASPEFLGSTPHHEIIAQIINSVKEAGIKCIDGKIIVNDGIFDQQMVHTSWSWDDLTNYYASGASGFNWHENLYFLPFSRSQVLGELTTVDTIVPNIQGLTFDNRVRIGSPNSGDNAYIYGDPYRLERVIEGTIPSGSGQFVIKGANPRPAESFAEILFQSFIQEGISVEGIGIDHNIDNKLSSELLSIRSPGLRALIDYANAKSNNHFCEAFYKTVGSRIGVGSFENAEKTTNEHLGLLGIDKRGLNQVDGSGLSSRNRVTANFMTSFITKKIQRLGLDEVQHLLPEVGVEGTVRTFLSGYPMQQSAWLKSGSINHVIAYAGVVHTRSDTYLSIAIMANGHDSNRRVRRQIEKIFDVIYEDF